MSAPKNRQLINPFKKMGVVFLIVGYIKVQYGSSEDRLLAAVLYRIHCSCCKYYGITSNYY